MSFEEVRVLRRRARAFLRYAEEALSDEEYDFTCFACEQAAQLFIRMGAQKTPDFSRGMNGLKYLCSNNIFGG